MQVGDLNVKIGLDLSDLRSGLESARASLQSMGSEFQSAFDSAKKSIGNTFDQLRSVGATISTVGVGIAAGLGYAVKTAADFDAQMSKVQALSGATKEQFEQLRQKAIELGSSTSFSASQAAEGMQMLAAAGMNSKQIMAAMPGVLAAAAASGEDMALVAETMGSALNSFGLSASSASHVADVLAQSANMSAISVQDMSYALKYVGPVAKSLGISLEDVSAAMVEMGNAGIKGEQAGTTLRSAMLSLVSPSKEAASQLAALGIHITDSSGKLLPFSNIIGQFNQKMKGMSDAQKASALSTIFGTEAVSGMMVVIDQGKGKLDQYISSLKNSNGAAQQAASVMQDNLKGSLDQLSGAFESARISIGEALSPAIRTMADGLSHLVEMFNSLSPATKQVIATLGAVGAAFALISGPILILIGSLPSLVAGISMLAPVFAALTGPVGLAVAAITGFVTVGTLVYTHWGQIKTFLIQTWNSIKATAQTTWNSIRQSVVNTVSGMWNSVVSFFQSAPGRIVGALASLKASLVSAWNGMVSDALNMGHQIVQGLVSGITEWASRAVEAAKGMVSDAIAAAKRLLGIHSPSRVFAEIGQYITEGLAKGIQDGTGKATDATERMVKAVMDAAAKVGNELSYSADLSKAKFDLLKTQMEDTASEIQKLNVQYRSLTEQLDVQRDKVALVSKEYEYMATIKGQDAEETKNLYLELLKEQKAQADLENQLRETTKSMEDQKKQLQDLIDQAKQAEEDYYQALANAAEDYRKKVEETNAKLIADEQKAWDDFENQVQQKADSLKNFVGLFDAIEPKQVSGTDLLKNLQDQVSAFEGWQQNISDLAKRGVDEGLIAELKQMGPKAAPEIAALNTLTDDQLKQYVELWRKKSADARAEAEAELESQRIETINKIAELRVQADQQLEQYRIDWQKKNEEIRKNALDEMQKIEDKYKQLTNDSTQYGVDLVNNFINGMRSQFDALRQTLEEMAATVDAYMPHSPAKVGPLKRLGEWGPALVQTFADGITASLPQLEAAVNGMAALTPAALQPIIAGTTTTNTTTNNSTVVNINVTGGATARSMADELMRELRKRGVRI